MSAPPPAFARVAFNARVSSLFDYHLPAGAPADIVGRRVQAEFGRRQAVGVVMETAEASDVAAGKLKTLTRVYDDMPSLPPRVLSLIRFCAAYYHCPIGVAAAAALPSFFRRAGRYQMPLGYRLISGADAAGIRGSVAAELLKAFAGGGVVTMADLQARAANPRAALKRLVAHGVVEECPLWEAAAEAPEAMPPPPPSAAQRKVLSRLRLGGGFAPHLLFGVTGGGKTEIYLRAAEEILAEGGQVLMLTPEIHLTPQVEEELRRRFPRRRLCVLHSALADGERAYRWLTAAAGAADIVLGTRLAVFTPMPRLRLIVADEEHDESYVQEDGMLFSARNVAVWRAKNERLPIISGSATPSLESYELARRGKWTLLSLPKRVVGRAPSFRLLAADDNLYHGMGNEFLRALGDCLQGGGQALVFINRRGYAPRLICRMCGKARACRRCSALLTWHKRRDMLCCHLCGFAAAAPSACECGGGLTASGAGTQRVEEALAKLFPKVPQLRLDSDALSGRRSFESLRDDIAAGKWRLLVGTKIIAKGHNFPRLSLIGVLNADQGLAAADFRAEERLFALLSQVVGRGTRNPDGCRVLIQTRHPSHPFYNELRADDVERCWRRLLEERKHAQWPWPPFARLALLRARHHNPAPLQKFMDAALKEARARAPAAVSVFDSVPPAVEKLAGWHRRQVLIHSASRRALHEFLRDWLPHLPAGARWQICVDPATV